MTALRSDEHTPNGRADSAAVFLSVLAAISIWLSAGVIYIGVSDRIAALPSVAVLGLLIVTLPAVAWFVKLRLEHAWPLAISLIVWLPFLGISSIWDGPIEGIVWALVVVGLIAARPPTLPPALSAPASAPWLAALSIAALSAVAFGQVSNVIPGGDEPHYLAATQSLLHDGDLKVANNYEQGDYLEYFPGRLEPHFLQRSKSGEIYSIHAPGVSVIVLPAFAIAGYSGAVWTMVLVAALSCALMWRLAYSLTGNSAAAWLGIAGVALSAPYFFHTFTIYPEIIGGLCVLLGAWLLVELSAGREPAWPALAGVGGALAVLPWLHTRFAVLAGILGLIIVARLITRPSALAKVAAFVAIPVVSSAAWFAFFYVIWGSPNPTVAYGADTSTSFAYVPRGVIGLLFDQQFGVLTTAPIYAIAFAGAAMLFKAQPRLAIELALVVIPYVLIVASYAMWWGGSAAPGRFLVAILPLAALPIAVSWARSPVLRSATIILAVVSALLLVPRAFEDNGRFIFNSRSGVDATVQWLSANYGLAAVVPSVHADGGLAALRGGLMWLATLNAAALAAAFLTRHRVAATFTATGVVVLGGVSLCAALVALTRGNHASVSGIESGHLRSGRELVALERLRPWHSTIVDIGTMAPLDLAGLLDHLTIRITGSSMVNRVPAGDYVLVAEPGSGTGAVTISLGRNDAPIVETTLDDLRSPQHQYPLILPVMARNLNVRVESADADGAVISMKPSRLRSSATRQPATRAARFGQRVAYFFDEWAYPERDGFWTRADGSATVVIDGNATQGAGLPMSVTAGPEPTTIRLAAGNWAESLSLQAGEKHDVVVPPPPDGAWTLRIHSGAGFRPSEREPGSRDVRKLAAWIAVH